MDVLGAISEELPLAVLGVQVIDPFVTLYGSKWALTVACPWELSGEGVAVNWESDAIDIDAETSALIGRAILSVT